MSDHMDIINEICTDISVGARRDRIRAALFSPDQVELFLIMEQHAHLWPTDMVYKGRNHTPRVVVKPIKRNDCIEYFLKELQLLNPKKQEAFISVGGSKYKAGKQAAIMPKVFWDAVTKSCIDKQLPLFLFRLTDAVLNY